eukprot:1905788-Pyramimonas_sp.AAC.1
MKENEKLGETVFKRYGKSCHEFLVGNQYYKVINNIGQEWARALPMDPRPLTKGKTAIAEFAAFRDVGATLRSA